jgi:hypothetical protein
MGAVNGTISLNAGSIGNQHISGAAADTLAASKMQHVFKAHTNFGTKIGDTPVTAEVIVFIASGAGSILLFRAGLNATGTGTSITFDLKKNGLSVLAAPITVTNANTNRQVLVATITSPSFAANDVFSVALSVGTSTGAQGPFATLETVENTVPS